MNGHVLAMGMFDGVHVGHRKLLGAAAKLAGELGAQPVACTFRNHPLSVFGREPRALMTLQERNAAIEALGLAVHMEEFTPEFGALSPEAFIENLQKRFAIRSIVCGFNYTYGKNKQGTPETLLEECGRMGCELVVIPPVLVEGAAVSSSRIRKLIEGGDVESVPPLLGQQWFYTGTVAPNKQIGSKIGFKTANIQPGNKVLARFGVYAGRVCAGNSVYGAVINVGVRPTVGEGSAPNIEAHMMDADVNCYGQCIRVELWKFLREERRFEGLFALREQIARDEAAAREYLAQSN